MDETKNVYIGNIPFDYTEEQVLEIAKSVGPVIDLKLLFDPMTGKSKGYAFIKYGDHETAASAVRNLNNMAIGNRNIKCSFSNDNSAFPDNSNGNIDKLPALPLGIQLFNNQTIPQAISSALAGLDQRSAFELIKEAKLMSQKNPTLMKKLLDQFPQLAHALVETSLLLNLSTPEIVKLCVNSKQLELDSLTLDHVQLLKQVSQLTDLDIDTLATDQKNIINKMRTEISNGAYGVI